MKTLFRVLLLIGLAACGGGGEGDPPGIIEPPPPKKPRALDPYVTIRIRHQLDTTTAVGRTHWHVYALLSGPYTNQNGIGLQGAISLSDARLGHVLQCMGAAADSIGQRFFSGLALGDTTTSELTPDALAATLAREWYDGDQVLPAGWKALTFPPTDLWDAQQFRDGHGLIPSDPIKWGWDWTGAGTTTLYERPYTDTNACNTYP